MVFRDSEAQQHSAEHWLRDDAADSSRLRAIGEAQVGCKVNLKTDAPGTMVMKITVAVGLLTSALAGHQFHETHLPRLEDE